MEVLGGSKKTNRNVLTRRSLISYFFDLPEDPKGDPTGLTNGHLVIRALFDTAKNGNVVAIKEILDSKFGKNVDVIKFSEVDPKELANDDVNKLLRFVPTEVLEEAFKNIQNNSDEQYE